MLASCLRRRPLQQALRALALNYRPLQRAHPRRAPDQSLPKESSLACSGYKNFFFIFLYSSFLFPSFLSSNRHCFFIPSFTYFRSIIFLHFLLYSQFFLPLYFSLFISFFSSSRLPFFLPFLPYFSS